jgi:hypothetical protein
MNFKGYAKNRKCGEEEKKERTAERMLRFAHSPIIAWPDRGLKNISDAATHY